MTPRISVIVPIYNTERFLPRCLESLANQTLREIEILLVDDGSADRSGEICADYVSRDARFRLIRQENRGLSAARNRALDEAAGDYVMFVDSDDWVEPDYCEAPWRLAEAQRADLVMFLYRSMRENGRPIPSAREMPEGPVDRKTALDLLFGVCGSTVWNKLYRRELFDGLRFPPDRFYEDVGTTYRLVLQAERIWSLNRSLYHYRQRSGSIVTRRSGRVMRDYYAMHTARYEALRDWGYEPAALEELRCAYCLTYAIRRPADPADPASLQARHLLRESALVPARFDKGHRLLLFLLRRCPPLFELGCRTLKLR